MQIRVVWLGGHYLDRFSLYMIGCLVWLAKITTFLFWCVELSSPLWLLLHWASNDSPCELYYYAYLVEKKKESRGRGFLPDRAWAPRGQPFRNKNACAVRGADANPAEHRVEVKRSRIELQHSQIDFHGTDLNFRTAESTSSRLGGGAMVEAVHVSKKLLAG